MSDMVQDQLWPDGLLTPCPMTALCENCDHPLSGHWQPGEFGSCRECGCRHWLCIHGGIPMVLHDGQWVADRSAAVSGTVRGTGTAASKCR